MTYTGFRLCAGSSCAVDWLRYSPWCALLLLASVPYLAVQHCKGRSCTGLNVRVQLCGAVQCEPCGVLYLHYIARSCGCCGRSSGSHRKKRCSFNCVTLDMRIRDVQTLFSLTISNQMMQNLVKRNACHVVVQRVKWKRCKKLFGQVHETFLFCCMFLSFVAARSRQRPFLLVVVLLVSFVWCIHTTELITSANWVMASQLVPSGVLYPGDYWNPLRKHTEHLPLNVVAEVNTQPSCWCVTLSHTIHRMLQWVSLWELYSKSSNVSESSKCHSLVVAQLTHLVFQQKEVLVETHKTKLVHLESVETLVHKVRHLCSAHICMHALTLSLL